MAKRTPLVCQQLENISRQALERYQDIIRRHVRRRQGVYALYRRGLGARLEKLRSLPQNRFAAKAGN